MDVVRAGAGTVVALLWTKGIPAVLPSLPGVGSLPGDLSVASAISPGGDIVGSNWTHFFAVGPRSPRAVLWHDGQILNLSPTVGEPSMATAVNALGQIVGWTTPRQASALVRHAFLLADGRVTDLGTLGGSSSEAYGVNTRGQVVGYSKTADGADHPFLWQNGVMTDLGTFGGRFNSQASAINARGQVVGWSTTGAGDTGGFLWEAGVMTDLGTLGGANSRAYDISESGRIVGTAQTSDGRSHWVVWTVR
jgi:probable HAF family extracellular repeat protein